MIENKESSFIVKGFCVRIIFFTEQCFYAISANWCVLTKIQLQNLAIIAYFDFYCSLSIVIVMTVISNISVNLKDSFMIYICGKFELPNYKSKVEITTSSSMKIKLLKQSKKWVKRRFHFKQKNLLRLLKISK